jgi:hypothetical protein
MVVLRAAPARVILGVAQIVLNVADLDAAAAPLLAAGCEETFSVVALPNHPAKRSMQSQERASLDMRHFSAPEGVAVELTRYGGAPPAGAIVYRRDGEGLALHAAEPAASEQFWSELGFAAVAPGRLENRAMLPAWRLAITLEPLEEPRRPTTVDAAGCVLVTMLTTDVDRELARLADTGLLLRSTAVWNEEIADRTPRVAMIEGPSGELIELLEAPRR